MKKGWVIFGILVIIIVAFAAYKLFNKPSIPATSSGVVQANNINGITTAGENNGDYSNIV